MNITIGQYINKDSWLHRLDPRMKILGIISLLVSIFLIPIPQWSEVTKSKDIIVLISLGVFFIGSLILTMSAKIPLRKALNGLKGIVFLLLFTFAIQILTNKDGFTIYETPMSISIITILLFIALFAFYTFTRPFVPFKIIYLILTVVLAFVFMGLNIGKSFYDFDFVLGDRALIRSVFLLFRIATIIILTSLLTFTTMTTDLNYGIEALLTPLKYIKVPVEIFSMMLSLTLRAIPTLLNETQKIMNAQASRGADFKENKLKDKIVQIISLLIPIFSISFKRAADMSDAMEVRGYVLGAKRTRIDAFKIRASDIVAVSLSIVVLGLTIWLKVL